MSFRPLPAFLFVLLVTATGLAQTGRRDANTSPTLVDWPFFAFAASGGY